MNKYLISLILSSFIPTIYANSLNIDDHLLSIIKQNEGQAELAVPHLNISNMQISGQINLDQVNMNRSPIIGNRYAPGSKHEFILNTASLYIDKLITMPSSQFRFHSNIHKQSSPSNNSVILQNAYNPFIEEVSISYIKMQNESAYFAKFGKQNILFGRYELYHMSPSLVQLLTQTNANALTIGWVKNSNVHAEIYLHQNNVNQSKIQGLNYGLNIGSKNKILGATISWQLSYIDNLASVDYIRSGLNQEAHHSPGYAAGFSMDYQKFNLTGGYIKSIKRFPYSSLSFKDNGAKPEAKDIYISYHFEHYAKPEQIVVGVQWSKESVNIGITPNSNLKQGMPAQRIIAKYAIQSSLHTQLEYEILFDHDYSVKNGGTNKSAITHVFRFAMSF